MPFHNYRLRIQVDVGNLKGLSFSGTKPLLQVLQERYRALFPFIIFQTLPFPVGFLKKFKELLPKSVEGLGRMGSAITVFGQIAYDTYILQTL